MDRQRFARLFVGCYACWLIVTWGCAPSDTGAPESGSSHHSVPLIPARTGGSAVLTPVHAAEEEAPVSLVEGFGPVLDACWFAPTLEIIGLVETFAQGRGMGYSETDAAWIGYIACDEMPPSGPMFDCTAPDHLGPRGDELCWSEPVLSCKHCMGAIVRLVYTMSPGQFAAYLDRARNKKTQSDAPAKGGRPDYGPIIKVMLHSSRAR
jgi:hypothetical protein